jgi:FkbM family methyltransferase
MLLLQKILVRASGNSLVQRMLEFNVLASQYLLGVGSGTGVFSSGEESIFKLLQQKSNPPYCIFDVGANQGQFLNLTLSQIGNHDASIHCFEPGRETFRILENSVQSDQRIRFNNFGLSKEVGKATLHYDHAGSGLASLTKRELGHFGIHFQESESIEISTIDTYCVERGISHIDLLKIDIEGHELDALAGAKNMFEQQAIDIVTFEFGGCNIDTRTFFQDFFNFFSRVNMQILKITPSGYLMPIDCYKEIHEQFRTTNFIAVKKS